jgi:aspartate kinase
MQILKFGGTSVGSPQGIQMVARIVRNALPFQPLVVVSAFSGVTDSLLAAGRAAVAGTVDLFRAKERCLTLLAQLSLESELISGELTELEQLLEGIAAEGRCTLQTQDKVASFGERISTKAVAAYMMQQGIPARAYNAYDLGFITDSNFTQAAISPEAYPAIKKAIQGLHPNEVPVVTGFLGKDAQGNITTIGRGGSDYTAAVIGAALSAHEIQIWTDVDGMMTADPRVVPGAQLVEIASFDEASELSYYGAKVLHPNTIIPAMRRKIPVRVLNTFNLASPGTTILHEAPAAERLTSIAAKKGVSIINIQTARMLHSYGFLHKVFKIFAEHKVPIDIVATSEINVSLTVSSRDVEGKTRFIDELRGIGAVAVRPGKASICVVGRVLKHNPLLLSRAFAALSQHQVLVHMISQGASEINISIVVDEGAVNETVRLLHAAFYGGKQQ